MNPKQRQSAQWQALPGCGHAERALQASWWQEHGAAHAGGPRAQQASKLETRALFAGSQGGTVARAGGNACGPLSARLDPSRRFSFCLSSRARVHVPVLIPHRLRVLGPERQVLYSITKHAMRRSAHEIGATSISFRPKVFSDPASVVD